MESQINLLTILIYGFSIIGIAILLFSVCLLVVPKTPDLEKFAMYECGFTPRESLRQPFNIHFYVVGLLFILFDIEITFLFPLALVLDQLSFLGMLSIYGFFIILFLGIFYEWTIGVLDWE